MSNSVLSQNKKARDARRWRATNTARKRFDGPLREFIKIKHANIFNEYSEFYRQLDRKYPNVRNLAATPMFRDWLSGIQQHESESVDLDEPTHHESQPEIPCQLTQHESQPETPCQSTQHERQPETPCQSTQHESDILTLAMNETLSVRSVIHEIMPQGIPQQVSASLQPFLPQINPNENIDEIINELEQDEAVRNILNPVVDEMIEQYNVQISTDNDEGIELNFYDELDLQPFNFDLEVDF